MVKLLCPFHSVSATIIVRFACLMGCTSEDPSKAAFLLRSPGDWSQVFLMEFCFSLLFVGPLNLEVYLD